MPSNLIQLTLGNSLTTLRSIQKEFYVGVDFFYRSYTEVDGNGWTFRSILHLSTGDDNSRIPRILLRNDDLMYVTSNVNGNPNWNYLYNQKLTTGQWYKLEVQQFVVEEKV